MSTPKKTAKPSADDLQNALQGLITQGKKEGMIRAADLNAILEKMQLNADKIEEIYDRFEAMNIQIVTAELELGDELGLDSDDGRQSGGLRRDYDAHLSVYRQDARPSSHDGLVLLLEREVPRIYRPLGNWRRVY